MSDLLISLCVPCMGRTRDLREALPLIVSTANASPPCEIVVLNYSSPDELDAYMDTMMAVTPLADGNFWTYRILEGKTYYNSPHARNLCVVAAHGDYIMQLATDALPRPEMVSTIRATLEAHHPVWMSEYYHLGRYIVCRRDEFMAMGGYDERLNLYAPEDKDISARLKRRGGSWARFSNDLLGEIKTPYREKLRYLDTRGMEQVGQKKMAMARLMQPIYFENVERGTLVANPEGWGRWE